MRIAMLLRIALAFVFCLATVPGALAGEQFAGEVVKVDTAVHKLTVKKPDGNRFTFVVDAKTAFSGSRKSLQDLAKGDQVTVEFQTGGGQYTALRISTP
jgi:Cu/Ag efflux protein CusF